MGKLMYCEACGRKAKGVKSKTDWVQVIFWGIFTFGIYWLYYFSWHTFKKEDKCPICGAKMIGLRKIAEIESKKPDLVLFAQPTKNEPMLNIKALKKGEIKKSWNGLYFTNIGELVLSEAKRQLDSPNIRLINEWGNDWETSISSDEVKINLCNFRYKGATLGAKNSYISIGFDGNIDKIRAIRDGILTVAGEIIYNINDWGKFTKVTGATKNEVENAWKKDIQKAPEPSIDSVESHEIDIPSQIKKLAELKEDGILTQEEFDSKKKELLAKI